MADNLQATPRNELLGLLSDAMYGGLDWMKDPRRSQQMQGLAGLLESTGIPQTTQRMAYGEPLTNIGRANVPLLKPETAEAMMNVAPLMPAAVRLASRTVKATEGLPVGMGIKSVGDDIFSLSKQEFLGKPRITKNANAADLKPIELTTLKDVEPQPFMGGKYQIKMNEDGAVVLDKGKPIASYNFGDTLVVDKPYRKSGLAQELVYEWRTSFPAPAVAEERTKASQAIQEKVWERIQNEKRSLPKQSPYPQQAALDIAQQRAALPVSEGGLGLPANNTPMDRARAMAGLTKENAMSQAHNIGELEFLAIPNQQFKGKLLYQSPSYSGKKGSVYKLGTINDEPAYLRQSDHFGGFATNLIEGSPEFKAIEEIQKLETGDIFGRVGKTTNQWNLKGGKAELKSQEIENALQEYRNSKTDSNPLGSDKLLDKYLKLKKTGKETGAIPLSELIGRLPEKKYSVVSETGERFEVPMIRMPDGSFRSRFAAFDPFRKDVATATAMGVALPDLLAAEPTPQPQSSGLLYPY